MIEDEMIKELAIQKIAINGILKVLTRNETQIKKYWKECEKSYKNRSLTEEEGVLEGQISIYDIEKSGKNE